MADMTPTLSKPVRATFRRIAEFEPSSGRILSVYFNLEPSQYATPQARASQARTLADQAEQHCEDGSLGHDDRMALKDDIDRVRRFLEDGGDAMRGAGALAVYCCTPSGLFEVVPLPHPVEGRATVGGSADLEPVADLLHEETWVVALINRATARIFRGTPDKLRQAEVVHDEVHRQHSQGGWSQARFERSVEKDVQNHVKNTVEILFGMHERAPFDRLAIGTPQEMWPIIESMLHPYLRERVTGRVDVDVEHSSIEDVVRSLRPVAEEHQRSREREALDRLAQELGRGGRAVAGREEVRRALEERRVETLLISNGAGGASDFIESALSQASDVLVVRHHDDLSRSDSVAALTRY